MKSLKKFKLRQQVLTYFHENNREVSYQKLEEIFGSQVDEMLQNLTDEGVIQRDTKHSVYKFTKDAGFIFMKKLNDSTYRNSLLNNYNIEHVTLFLQQKTEDNKFIEVENSKEIFETLINFQNAQNKMNNLFKKVS